MSKVVPRRQLHNFRGLAANISKSCLKDVILSILLGWPRLSAKLAWELVLIIFAGWLRILAKLVSERSSQEFGLPGPKYKQHWHQRHYSQHFGALAANISNSGLWELTLTILGGETDNLSKSGFREFILRILMCWPGI